MGIALMLELLFQPSLGCFCLPGASSDPSPAGEDEGTLVRRSLSLRLLPPHHCFLDAHVHVHLQTSPSADN